MSGPRERVARVLTKEIAEARLTPGDSVPIGELVERFNVTPDAARAAVRELAARGLASIAPDGTAVVTPEARWDVLDPDVLGVMLESERGPAILAEYLEARRVLETIVAGLAAERATADDLSALSRALARMTDALAMMTDARDDGDFHRADPEFHRADAEFHRADLEFHRADVEFHQALIAAARNRPLALAADPLQPALCVARRPLARPGLRRERGLPEHQRILAVVAQGDADAARRAMTEHLDTVEAYLREYAGLAGCGSNPCARPDER